MNFQEVLSGLIPVLLRLAFMWIPTLSADKWLAALTYKRQLNSHMRTVRYSCSTKQLLGHDSVSGDISDLET